jgi:hypothetical protein
VSAFGTRLPFFIVAWVVTLRKTVYPYSKEGRVTLTGIIGAMSESIDGISGFGDINVLVPVNFPAAQITFAKQVSDNKEPAMQRGFVNTEIQVKLMTDTSSTTFVQNDVDLDSALSALKVVFEINNGYYALDDEAILTYMGFDKDIAANGDVFSPGYLITKWNVLHRE